MTASVVCTHNLESYILLNPVCAQAITMALLSPPTTTYTKSTENGHLKGAGTWIAVQSA